MIDLIFANSLASGPLEWVLLAIALGAGVFLGMVWAKRSGASSAGVSVASAIGQVEEATTQATNNALSALEKLHTLADSVRADVGQHNDQVQEINRELASGGSTEAVMEASLAKLLEANANLKEQLDSAEQKLETQATEIERTAADARTDALTQVTNRRGFDDFLARRMSEWQRRARPFCLLMMDVDHFKQFNDTHGHQAGDEVLRRIAASLTETSRDMDFVTRYGGEEFGVIMADSTAAEALAGCERMRKAIEEIEVVFEGKKLAVTVSQGLAEVTPSDDIASIVRRADEALYTAKAAGRNRGHFHEGEATVPFKDMQFSVQVKGDSPEPKQAAPQQAENSTSMPAASEPLQSRLPGREIFQAELGRRIAESHRRGGELTVLLIEIDDFSGFQERFGDVTGDKVFETVGEFLGASFRKMDMIARASGSQFLAMLPGTHLHAAAQIAGRMQEAIAKCKIPIGSEEVRLTVGVGMAELSAVDDADSLLKRTVEALLASRQLGPNNAHAQTVAGNVPLAELAK